MDLYDFFNQIFHAVAQDGTLGNWATTNFGRRHKVYVDFPVSDPPGADDRPYIIFEEPGIETHQERRENDYFITATLSIDTENLEIVAEDNLTVNGGTQEVLDFISHLKRIVAANLPANFVVGYSAAAGAMETDTEIIAVVDIAFGEKVTIGIDPLD